MATKTFYGRSNEIQDVEQLLKDIDCEIHPKTENHMKKILKGLQLLKNKEVSKNKKVV